MTLSASFTECFVVPGKASIIDGINPATGRSYINSETLEEIRRRYPEAVVMSWEAWQAEQAAKQAEAITWELTTRSQYEEMLEVLPPAAWRGDWFLVGEPMDHCFASGYPRFEAYRIVAGVYEVASRPLTKVEFRKELEACR